MQNTPANNFDHLMDGIARGIEAHVRWTHALLRCAFLHESPGDDMLRPNAHELCRFGLWFLRVRPELDQVDAALTEQIATTHADMHAAVSLMCTNALHGKAARAQDLALFERNQSAMVTYLNLLRQRIAAIATQHDVLTGLPLRHGLEHAFTMRSKDSIRTGHALWLAMVDVDRFKSVNDTHGHGVGDLALRHVAGILASTLRHNDVLIRFGGEEFLGLFLLGRDDSIHALGERILQKLRSNPLRTDTGLILPLTATVGFARVRVDEELRTAVERADYALLEGKTFGRDRYVLAAD